MIKSKLFPRNQELGKRLLRWRVSLDRAGSIQNLIIGLKLKFMTPLFKLINCRLNQAKFVIQIEMMKMMVST